MQLGCITESYKHTNVDDLGVKLRDNEMKLSIELIEQIQKASEQKDGIEDYGQCPGTSKDINQETSESTVVNPGLFLEDHKSYLWVSYYENCYSCSRFKYM